MLLFCAVGLDELKLEEAVAEGSLDFYEWTSLISQIEKTYPVIQCSHFRILVGLLFRDFLFLGWGGVICSKFIFTY